MVGISSRVSLPSCLQATVHWHHTRERGFEPIPPQAEAWGFLGSTSMKITELKLNFSETIRPADFCSRSCGLECHVMLDEGDDVKKVTAVVMAGLKRRVAEALKEPPKE